MQRFVSALAVIALIACADGTGPRSIQSSIDDSHLPPSLRTAYFEDAARLALRDLLPTGFAAIPIPRERIQPYYGALVAVYNATLLPARDTVVEAYAIHTYPYPSTRSLVVAAASAETWVQHLIAGDVPTGNATVDDLLARYALTLGTVWHFRDGEALLTLTPDEPLNIAALAPLFSRVAGVRYAEPDGFVGDGNNLEGSIPDSRVLLSYSVGSGDCPSGCINRRYYRFAVSADGMVEYLGASGILGTR
jgi:hypothetical protein